jgi:hypothetical protein
MQNYDNPDKDSNATPSISAKGQLMAGITGDTVFKQGLNSTKTSIINKGNQSLSTAYSAMTTSSGNI